MSKRKGVQVPRNGFLETISSRFSEKRSCFVLGSASSYIRHIVYCSDGFCDLTGYPRSQVMQRSCSCNFLYGENTDEATREQIWQSLVDKTEYHHEKITLYKQNGSSFDCELDIITRPRKNADDLMFLVSLKEIESDATTNIDLRTRTKGLQVKSPTFNKSQEKQIYQHQRRRSRGVLADDSQPHLEDAMSNRRSARRACQIDHSAKKSKYVIPHYGYFRTVWDWITLVLSFYVLVSVPYYASLQALHISEFGFQNSTKLSSRHFTFWFDIGLELIFIIDIALNFRTTFVNKRGQLESYSKKIASYYLKSTFLTDFLCSIPFDFISLLFIFTSMHKNIPFDILKLVRGARMFKFYKKITNLSHYRPFVLLYLTIMFGLIAHWIACGWFAIGWFEFHTTIKGANDGPGWLFELGESLHTPFYANKTGGPKVDSVYIASLYFTMSSLTSVGFGNVSANTNTEKIFSVVIMLIGAIMHAYIFGNITAIIQRIYATRSELARREGNLKEFLKKNRFKKPLYRKLTGYFQTSWSLNKGVDEQEVISEFPKDLQADIALHLHSDLLELPIFKDACEGCKRYASLHASRRMVAPEEILIHIGDPLEHAYLVCSGSLEATKGKTLSAFLGKGDFFGGDVDNDNILVSQLQVQALTFCELQCISIHGLKQIAMLYPSRHNIAKEIGDDYSCKLWEYLAPNSEESKRQRKRQIQRWHKHYNANRASDKSSSSSSDVSCDEVKITVEPDTDQEREVPIEYDEKGSIGLLTKNGFPDNVGERHTLQVPTVEIAGFGSMMDASSHSSIRCSSPCLRSSERRNGIKKRVSFDDSRYQDKKRCHGSNRSELIPPACSVLSTNLTSCDDSISKPISSGPSHQPVSVRSNSPLPSSKDSSEEVSYNQEDCSTGNPQYPPKAKQEQQTLPGRRSSSPGTSSELRRRRRRRKPITKKDRTSASSSSEEATSQADSKRERKFSVVEIYRDPVKSLVYQRHSSPESRSSECGCQVAAMERKLNDLENLVLAMSRNVQMILDAKIHLNVGEEDGDESGYISKFVDTANPRQGRKGNSELDLLSYADEHEFNSKVIGNDHHSTSELMLRPSIMNNRTDHMSCNIPDELRHTPILRRPNSAPSFCSTSSNFTNDHRMMKTFNEPNTRFNADMDLIALKSIASPARYNPVEICNEDTFNVIQETVFVDEGNYENGPTKFSDQSIPSVFCFPTDGGAAEHDNDDDYERPLLEETRQQEGSNSNPPIISISDYDQFMMRESVNTSTPARLPIVRDSQSFLQIPRKRQLGGGSESGYSTSPSPDISCV